MTIAVNIFTSLNSILNLHFTPKVDFLLKLSRYLLKYNRPVWDLHKNSVDPFKMISISTVLAS